MATGKKKTAQKRAGKTATKVGAAGEMHQNITFDIHVSGTVTVSGSGKLNLGDIFGALGTLTGTHPCSAGNK